MLDDNKNKKWEKTIVFIIVAALIIGVLSILAVFSGVIMRLLGFEYETVGSFILYFIIASFVSYPMNLMAGAWPKALLTLGKLSKKMSVCTYVILDTIATFWGFRIVDYFMPAVSASAISLMVIAVIFALFEVDDIAKNDDL